jgi:hypothetical protein
VEHWNKELGHAEEHQHHITRWYGKKNPQGANDWAVLMDGHLTQPYRCISGAHAYGGDANDEALLFGTADVLWDSRFVCGDFDEFLVVANSADTVYLIRIIWGTGTMAAAITAGQYSTTAYIRKSTDTQRLRNTIKVPLIGINAKIWAQCQNVADNATIDFFVGVHGYTF